MHVDAAYPGYIPFLLWGVSENLDRYVRNFDITLKEFPNVAVVVPGHYTTGNKA